ncbi:MAG: flagellar biosynthesis/type III secretory pathway protein FliH [Vicingaceae bacterium]|jgi:flagellar biosynthesis/type III secretory pathway protein FliH
MKTIILTIILGLSSFLIQAQPPGGRQAGGPEVMIAREKQNVLEKVEKLTEDQKLLVSGIYDEFAVTLKEAFEEARESGTREGMREKMQGLREEKDALIKDVLNEEQFATYQALTSRKREQGSRPSEN